MKNTSKFMLSFILKNYTKLKQYCKYLGFYVSTYIFLKRIATKRT